MADDKPKFPDQEELERELSEYLSKKYGHQVRVISPMMMPNPRESEESRGATGADRIRFDMKPEELEAYLDQFVIKQDEAKAVLATKICTHYNRIKYQRRNRSRKDDRMVGRIKNNILLIGPTGVGKTYLVKLIAQKLGVPFVKGDATKFSETGYVGADVEDLVRELLIEAGDDLELAQYGIIYLDEIDKIAGSHSLYGPDVSRSGVQRALLKPLEETEIDTKVAHDPISQMQALEQFRKSGKREKRTINTKDILFIVSGAFNGLAPIVKNRLQKQGIGFGAQVQSKGDEYKFLAHAKAEDLIAFGFESEFVGRLPVTAVLEPLTVEDLHDVLKNPNNPIILAKKEDFRSYGIDIKFEDEALLRMAELAFQEKTGARGLVSVIERVLLPFEKSLPSSSVRFVVITGEVVRNPVGELQKILTAPEAPELIETYMAILEREKKGLREHVDRKKRHYVENYPMIFSESRLDLVLEQHLRTGVQVESIFDDVILHFNQIRVFESDFYDRSGFKLRFDEEAINEIIARALMRDTTATAICIEISRDYEYAFRLLSERIAGMAEFVLPRKAVVQPNVYVEDLIRETYRKHS